MILFHFFLILFDINMSNNRIIGQQYAESKLKTMFMSFLIYSRAIRTSFNEFLILIILIKCDLLCTFDDHEETKG